MIKNVLHACSIFCCIYAELFLNQSHNKLDFMKRISVQIAHDSLQLLKRRALQKGVSVSALVNELMMRGLQQTMSETEASPKNLERYVLKSVFETLLLVRTLVNSQDEHLLTEASQKARALATQALEHHQHDISIT
jgi:hypothetical protein